MKNNRKARSIMIVNALIGSVSTLVLFFLYVKMLESIVFMRIIKNQI
jgi:hypothetical protein